jgi:hypothetical protein
MSKLIGISNYWLQLKPYRPFVKQLVIRGRDNQSNAQHNDTQQIKIQKFSSSQHSAYNKRCDAQHNDTQLNSS